MSVEVAVEVADLVRGPVETHVITDLSHILRRQPGPASLAAYKKEIRQPVDERVTLGTVDWANETLGLERRSPLPRSVHSPSLSRLTETVQQRPSRSSTPGL